MGVVNVRRGDGRARWTYSAVVVVYGGGWMGVRRGGGECGRRCPLSGKGITTMELVLQILVGIEILPWSSLLLVPHRCPCTGSSLSKLHRLIRLAFFLTSILVIVSHAMQHRPLCSLVGYPGSGASTYGAGSSVHYPRE